MMMNMMIMKLDRHLPRDLIHQPNIEYMEDHEDNDKGHNVELNLINRFFL